MIPTTYIIIDKKDIAAVEAFSRGVIIIDDKDAMVKSDFPDKIAKLKEKGFKAQYDWQGITDYLSAVPPEKLKAK